VPVSAPPTAPVGPSAGAPAGPDDVVIDVRGAGFGYGERTVLHGADLTVRRGEIVAVVGPNGSGKSTLMKGILGLNERTEGSVTLFGVPADDFHDRARLGYVPQRHTLSASVSATAEEIVETGRLPRLGWLGRLRATDRQVVARSLEVVGLGDRAATEVSTLSGGQQRRVLIARALAGQPDVLERLVERGVTMVVVTHEIGPLERLLTRIVVVDAGRIVFDGTPEAYAASRETVHHEHDSHHHDLELETARPVLGRGPFASARGGDA